MGDSSMPKSVRGWEKRKAGCFLLKKTDTSEFWSLIDWFVMSDMSSVRKWADFMKASKIR